MAGAADGGSAGRRESRPCRADEGEPWLNQRRAKTRGRDGSAPWFLAGSASHAARQRPNVSAIGPKLRAHASVAGAHWRGCDPASHPCNPPRWGPRPGLHSLSLSLSRSRSRSRIIMSSAPPAPPACPPRGDAISPSSRSVSVPGGPAWPSCAAAPSPACCRREYSSKLRTSFSCFDRPACADQGLRLRRHTPSGWKRREAVVGGAVKCVSQQRKCTKPGGELLAFCCSSSSTRRSRRCRCSAHSSRFLFCGGGSGGGARGG